jgi:hypothetical protein
MPHSGITRNKRLPDSCEQAKPSLRPLGAPAREAGGAARRPQDRLRRNKTTVIYRNLA